jgi:hypothetical protein
MRLFVIFEVDEEWQNTTQRSVPSPFKRETGQTPQELL